MIPLSLLINMYLATWASFLQVTIKAKVYYHFTFNLALGQELSDKFTQDNYVLFSAHFKNWKW